ncbi:SAM-dependent methyltransferase [Lipingzhangella sp. LS1_29]|uniref:SAM-dependent methyltransferase n=1 Tax=Lipingzhangella rawalii TaxID=2055835 RepID=A0ABU2H8G8_9ACTN|nr:SAM-dependent methyltransferase [Lipingzhangella rawalii]MDS1270889.1 SAM-dependent methyltransferase [Lipingzhangella rawalii]
MSETPFPPKNDTELHTWPPEIDMSTPSVARGYDALLGGKDNFEVDRQAMEQLKQAAPECEWMAHSNRGFLGRAVDMVARSGVRQFLDLGSGLPTAENTHEIAQRVDAGARVVYVDNDPIVLAHGRALLASDPETTTVLSADLCDIETVLNDTETRRLIDFDQPVCIMIVSLLHCLPDEADPFGVIARYMDRVPTGSYLVFSHIVSDDAAAAQRFTDIVHGFGTPWGRVRSPEEAERVFEGLQVLEPGVVEASTWRNGDIPPSSRPRQDDKKLWEHAGVARKEG